MSELMNDSNIEGLEFQYDVFLPYLKENQLLLAGGATSNDEETIKFGETVEISFDASIKDADKLDYCVAISSGVIAAAIDIFWVGKISLENAAKWGEKEVNDFVLSVANSKTTYKGDDLQKAIKALEEKYQMAGDQLTNDFGGGYYHHLRDFSHHPSIVGLIASILMQLTGYGIGTDTAGAFKVFKLPNDELRGKNFEERIFNGIVVWVFHLISDMAGSNQYAGAGTGIPGPLLSMFKEMSSIPGINKLLGVNEKGNSELSVYITKLFDGTTFLKKDAKGNIIKDSRIKFDLRTEIGLAHELSRQALPVIINECIVRGFYFVRRLFEEIRNNNITSITDLSKLEPHNFMPINSRSLTRMISVSSGVFMTIDATEAAISNLIIKKNVPGFFLSINYIGIGRFVFACKADSKYIAEDFRRLFKDYLDAHKDQDGNQDIPEMQYFVLSEQQSRIMNSLKLHKVLYDIGQSNGNKRYEDKQLWCNEWRDTLAEGFGITSKEYFVEDAGLLYDSINEEIKDSKEAWLYVAALELFLFNPYYPLNSESNKKFKGLKLDANYENEIFCRMQNLVTENDFSVFKKSSGNFESVLTGKTKKMVASIAATAAITLATGGIAFAFAPEIAVLIAGQSVAGLYGAALTSSSLALIGGGSLAAGGLGMAGGTAIIVGGGALLGATGSGIASLSTSMLLTSKEYILDECVKMLTFCKTILVDKYDNKETVMRIQNNLEQSIDRWEKELSDEGSDDNKKAVQKRMAANMKYMKKCNELLIQIMSD